MQHGCLLAIRWCHRVILQMCSVIALAYAVQQFRQERVQQVRPVTALPRHSAKPQHNTAMLW
jgi:hypothetical protein